MAERKPIVIIDGNLQELPSGDTLSGGGGSAEYPSFTYNSGKHLAVNNTEDNVEWVDPPEGASGISIVEETTTARVASNEDLAGNIFIEMNNAGTQTYIVNSGLTGTEPVTLIQKGAGSVTVVAGTSVTINSLDGNLVLAGQYASATLVPSGTDTYYLIGALTS